MHHLMYPEGGPAREEFTAVAAGELLYVAAVVLHVLFLLLLRVERHEAGLASRPAAVDYLTLKRTQMKMTLM